MQSHHAYTSMFFHIVWATKNRQPYINSKFKKLLYEYIGKTATFKGWHLLAVGGIDNHIHILIQKTSRYTISEVVCVIKSNSSRFIRDTFLKDFSWQGGYGVFTVDISSLPRIKKYILNQEEHHKQMTFEKEYVLLLDRYKVAYDLQNLFS